MKNNYAYFSLIMIMVFLTSCKTDEFVPLTGAYRSGFVHCQDSPTDVVDVHNPITGKTWMDRNLGAKQVATSSTDASAFGDLFQWGRSADGHQCRNSETTNTLSSKDQHRNNNFILAPTSPADWRSPQQNNLWQGVNGVNNPCPIGYRVPTETELNEERLSWISNDPAGAFSSPLKLPLAGSRSYNSGYLFTEGSRGYYWSSTVNSVSSSSLYFGSGTASMHTYYRAYGASVRCIRD